MKHSLADQVCYRESELGMINTTLTLLENLGRHQFDTGVSNDTLVQTTLLLSSLTSRKEEISAWITEIREEHNN